MPRPRRQKISTTIAPENQAFLKSLIKRRKASTLSEAVDRAIAIARRADSRERLEAATEAYFASLSPEALTEENRLGEALADEAGKVNFDE
jgi:uncharacterized iron-regulated protein